MAIPTRTAQFRPKLHNSEQNCIMDSRQLTTSFRAQGVLAAALWLAVAAGCHSTSNSSESNGISETATAHSNDAPPVTAAVEQPGQPADVLDETGEKFSSSEIGTDTDRFTCVDGSDIEIPIAEAPATVLIFVSSTCPIANGYAPEINRMTEEYRAQNVRICLVHTETDLSQAAAEKHLQDFGYQCPVLLDPNRTLVTRTGATITPEVAVLSPDGELLYRGRIDDRFPDIGIQKSSPAKTELRDALDAIVAGNPIPVARTQAIGCYIE